MIIIIECQISARLLLQVPLDFVIDFAVFIDDYGQNISDLSGFVIGIDRFTVRSTFCPDRSVITPTRKQMYKNQKSY